MTAVWSEEGGWHLLSPVGFSDEAALHSLVEQNPELLPLAGNPRLAVLGREVVLGGNKADLLAIESSGRPCVIEVKLASNSEARRAVIAQVLSYAAYLQSLTLDELETKVLASHLSGRGFASLAEAAQQAGQGAEFDATSFKPTLEQALREGAFRLVLVLDDAPVELIRTVDYLESVTLDALLIDLITVRAYEVGGKRVLVPQRIDPERRATEQRPDAGARSPAKHGNPTPGVDEFVSSIEDAPAAAQQTLRRLADWGAMIRTCGLPSAR